MRIEETARHDAAILVFERAYGQRALESSTCHETPCLAQKLMTLELAAPRQDRRSFAHNTEKTLSPRLDLGAPQKVRAATLRVARYLCSVALYLIRRSSAHTPNNETKRRASARPVE